MPTAFVLINAEMGSEGDILSQLRKLDNIAEVYQVYGVYDLVVKIEAETSEKVKEIIAWEVRRLEKVRSTLTLIVGSE